MTRTKLQKTGGGVPYVSFSASLIQEAFMWEKGHPIRVNYDEENKQIIVSEDKRKIKDNGKKLQTSSPKSTPYIYLSKKIIGNGFGWEVGQQLNVEHDVKRKRIMISELNGETVTDGKK
jgi:hypothetical protein